MGGQRTKKGTRKGARQHQNTNTPTAFIAEKTEFDEFLEKHGVKQIRSVMTDVTGSDHSRATESELRHHFDLASMAEDNQLNGRKLLNEKECYLDALATHKCLLDDEGNTPLQMRIWKGAQEQLVELRDTGDAGMGVFATTDLPKGEVVTIYPAHLFCKNNGDGTENWSVDTRMEWDKEALDEFVHGEGRIYTMKNRQWKYIGLPDKTDKWWLIGHMVNDRGYNGTEDYEPYSRANCFFYGNAIMTTQDIKQGEELSVSYGSAYWFAGWNTKKGKSHHELNKNYQILYKRISNAEETKSRKT
jgi:hypothetical protein